MARSSKLESGFQDRLIEKLKTLFPGCMVFKMDQLQGIPDLLVLHGKKWASLECKHRLTMVNTPLNRALGVRNQIFHSNDTRSAVAWTWERMMSATCRRSSKSMLSQFPRWEDRYSIFCGETLSAFSAAISFINP